jgi:hypothetical protein
MVDDNDRLFLLMHDVIEGKFDLIHVEYVRFYHQLFHVYYHVLFCVVDQIHFVRIRHDENVVLFVDDHVLAVKVIVIVIEIEIENVLSMDNIIHNNQDMF